MSKSFKIMMMILMMMIIKICFDIIKYFEVMQDFYV